MKRDLILYQLFLRPFTPEGTIKGAEKMLPHIASLGFDIVYVCPFFKQDDDLNPEFWSPRQKISGCNNPQNPYRIKNYFEIDEEYGTKEDLHSFVHTAHKLGMLVLFDLVYFHCGPTADFLVEHPDFVCRDENGDVINGRWGFPQLNMNSSELREYLYSNMEYYIREFEVDGYRCDIADYLPLDFWAEGKRRIQAINPDAILLDEGQSAEFMEEVFDAHYGFKWSYALRDTLKQLIPASQFIEAAKEVSEEMPPNTLGLKFVDTHDTVNKSYDDRFEKVVGHNLAEASLVINFTSYGIPFVYNGNEVCDATRHSIFGNRIYTPNLRINWSNAVTAAGLRRMNILRELANLRKQNKVLTEGTTQWLEVGDADHIIAYRREWEGTTMLVIVNAADKMIESTVESNISPDAKVLMQHNLVVTGNDGLIKFAAESGGYIVIEQ